MKALASPPTWRDDRGPLADAPTDGKSSRAPGQDRVPGEDDEDGEPTPPPRPVVWAGAAARAAWAKPLPPAIPTGIGPLDEAIGGLRAGNVYYLPGGPGAGKSALGYQIARHVQAVCPVLIATGELPERQVLARLAAPLLGEHWSRLESEGPSAAERIAAALDGLRITVLEMSPATNLSQELDRVAQGVGQVPTLILDYMQAAARRRARLSDRHVELRQVVADLSDELVTWARDTGGRALVIASAARGTYAKQPGKKKQPDRSAEDYITATKESGDVEYDGAGIFYLDGPPCPLNGSAPRKLHVAKSRFGGEGVTIGLSFAGALGLYSDDPVASLTGEERALCEAVVQGATTQAALGKAIGTRKEMVGPIVKRLVRRGVLGQQPIRLLVQLAEAEEGDDA